MRAGNVRALIVFAALGWACQSHADPYLLIPGIAGKSSNEDRQGWIEIESYSLSVTDGGCRGVRVVKRVDETSSALLASVLNNQRFGRVDLDTDTPRTGQAVRIKMLDATVKSIQLLTASAGAATEQLQFEAERVIVEFWVEGESGFRQTAESSFTCRQGR